MNFKAFRLVIAVGVALGLHSTGLAAGAPFVFAPELSQSVPLIQADQVHQLGITGAGVGVAIVDSFLLPGSPLCDFPHGVWVEGVVKAVAPGAQVFRYNVESFPDFELLDCLLDGNDIIAGLRQILAQHRALGIKVVNLSIGSGRFSSPCFLGGDEAADIIQSLIAQGVVVVAASGNEGFADALVEPACLPGVVSVGAVYDHTSLRVEETQTCAAQAILDTVACYSNAAPFLDVLAPGDYIQVFPGLEGLGTSAAAPHVAGVVALLLQANPALTPAQVESLLKQTGVPVFDPRNGLTFPRVNALSAARAALGGTTSPLPPASLKGDVNLDGRLDRQDVRLLSSAVRGRVTLTPEQAQAGDVAMPCDGQPNGGDLRLLARIVRNRATSSCGADLPLRQDEATRLKGIRLTGNDRRFLFLPEGDRFQAAQVRVFDLAGRLVFADEQAVLNRMSWDLLDFDQQPVPNGVYLYWVRAQGSDGQWINEIGKLVVFR